MVQTTLDFGSRTDTRVQAMLLRAVEICAESFAEFSADDVWVTTRCLPWSHVHYDPTALGVAMRQAQRNGWIQATGQWRKSKSKVCHHRPVLIWRSLIRT